MKTETTIPFSGFYESVHSQHLDDAFETMISDDRGDIHPGLFDRAFDAIDWNKARHAYAEFYCDCFARLFGITLTYADMVSPREYNFQTDRIFAQIDLAEVRRLYSLVDHNELRKLAKERFTSRDGFSSFYSPNINTWGELETWDHNKVGTLVEAFIVTHDNYFEHWDWEVVGRDYVYTVIDGAITDGRPFTLADYLRDRGNRKYRSNTPKGFDQVGR